MIADDVLEMIHLYAEDDPELEAKAYKCIVDDVGFLKVEARKRLQEMGRCQYCGCKLIRKTHRQYHDDSGIPELYVEEYCPECGV